MSPMRLVIFFLVTIIGLVMAATLANFSWAHSDGVTIVMTKDGFEPAEMTVHRGEKITFLNSDTVPHWPASDFHPTHDLYPEFDPRKAVGAGEAWVFTPERGGEWRFHDHL